MKIITHGFEQTQTFYANILIAFLYEVVNPWVVVRNKIFNSIDQMKKIGFFTVYYIIRYIPTLWVHQSDYLAHF